MKRNVTTYNGMSVSTPTGTGFRFMPFLDVDFLKENLSNNLHISKLFILSLSIFQPIRVPARTITPYIPF